MMIITMNKNEGVLVGVMIYNFKIVLVRESFPGKVTGISII